MAAAAAAIANASSARVGAELYWPPFSTVLDSLDDQFAAGQPTHESDQVRALEHPALRTARANRKFHGHFGSLQ